MEHFWDTEETIPAGLGFSHFGGVHLAWLGAAAVLAVVYVASAALGHLAQRCFDLLAAFGEKNLSKQKLRNLLCKVSFSK